MRVGADVSTWQKDINYAEASKEISFIIPRTGYYLTTDNKFRKNVAEATRWGLDIPAVYHFSYALNVKDAIAEADYACSEVAMVGLPKSTIVYYDFEYDSITYAKKKGIKIGAKEINDFTIAFCDRCIELGYRTGIYLNNDFYKNYYYQSTISKYSIWLADWTGGPDHPCYIQQYTSQGKVSGIQGNVDMNYIFDQTSAKTVHDVAIEVIGGMWGNGPDRKVALTQNGYDYDQVQAEVNKIINGKADNPTSNVGNSVSTLPTVSKIKSGAYETTDEVYIRKAPGTNKEAVCKVPKGEKVYCSGFHSSLNSKYWLYVDAVIANDGVIYSGYCCEDNLKKVE